MDIFRFINSDDVKNYLKEINYEFSTIEIAWIIYHSFDATLEEKHKAWQEIIDTMPDMEFYIRFTDEKYKSLHQFLKDYMNKQNSDKDLFFKIEQNTRYRLDTYPWGYGDIFEDYDSCYESAFEKLKENKLKYIEITKISTIEYQGIKILFNAEKEILNVDYFDENNDKYDNRKRSPFECMELNFPLPFKKGDILCESERYGLEYSPIVFERLNTSNLYDYKETFCYTVNRGEIQHTIPYNYLNLKYFTGELAEKKKLLYTVSDYIKGNIGLDKLMRICLINEFENRAKYYKSSINQREEMSLKEIYETEELPF